MLNGSEFTSAEGQIVLSGIEHWLAMPYMPKQNGHAKRDNPIWVARWPSG